MAKSHEKLGMNAKRHAIVLLLFLIVALGLWAINSLLNEPAAREPVVSKATGRGLLDQIQESLGPSLDPDRNRLELRGRVTDPRGAPLEGAQLQLGPGQMQSDAQGRFVLPHTMDPLTVSLDGYFASTIDAREHRTVSRGKTSDGTGEELYLVLFPGSYVEGHIRGPDGSPVAGAQVILTQDLYDLQGAYRKTTSGDDGTWRSPLLPAGQIHALFRHPDYQTADRIVSLSIPSRTRLDVVLEKGKPLLVHVKDEHDRPLADAQVWLDLEPASADTTAVDSRYLGRTGDLGRLVTRRDARREARVRVRLAGHREARRDVTSREVEIVLRPSPALRAQAIDAKTGLPVPPTRVELEYLAGDRFEKMPHRGLLFRSLADGKIRLGLPPLPGTYRLAIEAGRDLFGTSKPVEYDGESSPSAILVRLERRLRLNGFVHADGGPVAAAEVELLEDSRGSTLLYGVRVPVRPRVLRNARSSEDGRFHFAARPGESYRVAVRHSGYADFLSPPIQFPLLGAQDYPIFLDKGGRLSGRVVASDGGGISDIPVVLFSSNIARVAWTNDEGRYHFEDLPPASDYVLIPGNSDGDALPPNDTAGEAESVLKVVAVVASREVVVDVDAHPSLKGSLAGRIQVDGAPRSCTVQVSALEDSDYGRRVTSEPDGTFLVRALVPGKYRVQGLTVPFSSDVTIPTGRRAEIEVRVESLEYSIEVFSNTTGKEFADEAANLAWAELTPLAPTGTNQRQPIRDGRTAFRGIFPGAHRLRILAPGFVALDEKIELDSARCGRPERWGLTQGKEIKLRLESPDGKPFRGTAEVVISQGERIVHRETRTIDVELELPPLAEGEYLLKIRSETYNFTRKLTIRKARGRR